jgi:hypothetical protein
LFGEVKVKVAIPCTEDLTDCRLANRLARLSLKPLRKSSLRELRIGFIVSSDCCLFGEGVLYAFGGI